MSKKKKAIVWAVVAGALLLAGQLIRQFVTEDAPAAAKEITSGGQQEQEPSLTVEPTTADQ